MKKAIQEGAVILLIIAAGGAFGGALQQTGIAGQLAAHFQGIHALALPAGGATIHPVYFAIAIGCGSKPFPWNAPLGNARKRDPAHRLAYDVHPRRRQPRAHRDRGVAMADAVTAL